MEIIFEKILELGKIAYTSTRKTNAVELTLRLREMDEIKRHFETLEAIPKPEAIELSICGGIWDGKRYDYVSCGQNIDTIAELIPTKKVKRIQEIWERYHLNDLRAGTKKQIEAIKEWESQGNKYSYTNACEYLKSIDLFEDRGYEYGHGWLFEPVPAEIIEEVKQLFS